jgi:hypothetical protein
MPLHQHSLFAAVAAVSTLSAVDSARSASIIPVFQSRAVTTDSIVSTPSQQDFENITAPDFNEFSAQAKAMTSNANALSQTSAEQFSTINSCAIAGVGQTNALAQSSASGFHGYSIANSTCYVVFDIDEPVEYLIHGNLGGSGFGHASLVLQKFPAGSGVLFTRTASGQSTAVHHRATLNPARYILQYDAIASAAAENAPAMTNAAQFDLQFTLCFIPADINVDGAVNVIDLLGVINTWGTCPAEPQPCAADINLDGLVNVADLLAVISAWGS